MIQDYRCSNCHKLLFRGSLKLLSGRKYGSESFIEPKCERCGKINHFVYELDRELRKDDFDQASILESAG